jgi:hypothetical protein
VIQGSNFEGFERGHYSEEELSACNMLLTQFYGMVNDPYLLHELHRVSTVYETQYKYAKNRIGGAVFSLDRMPGHFDPHTAMISNALSKVDTPAMTPHKEPVESVFKAYKVKDVNGKSKLLNRHASGLWKGKSPRELSYKRAA